MPDQLRSANKVRLNPLQAVKRAFMHRGLMVGGRQPAASSPAQVQTKSGKKQQLEAKLKTDTLKPQVTKEFGEKKGLDKPPQDSSSAKGPDNLVELTESSLDVLFEATTVFPLTLFPDTITLDREKVTIAKRSFWRTANITSTPISEIMTVESNVGPFFGSIHLTFRFFADNQRTVNFLWRDDATQMQRLLHGYIIAHRREIDCSSVNLEDLKTLLLELGQGASD